MRKAAIAAAAVVLILVLAVLLLPRLVSLESFRPRVVAAIEARTGRTVSLEGLSLSLFPSVGVKVRGLSVGGDARRPGETMIAVPEGEIRLAIAPLFSGRAEFDTIVLRRPKILFRKHADGTHSATDILNRLSVPEKAPAAEGPKMTVSLRNVAIEEADLSLRIEEERGPETRWDVAPFTFRLEGIGGHRNGFEVRTRVTGAVRGEIAIAGTAVHERGAVSAPEVFDIAAKGKVFGQEVTVDGKMSAPAGAAEVDLSVRFPKIDMAALPGLFAPPPAALVAAKPEGYAVVSAQVTGGLPAMGFEIEADLTRAGWTLAEGARKHIDTPCTVLVQGHRFPDTLILSNAEFRTPPVLLIANASFGPAPGQLDWSASARVSSLADLARARGLAEGFAPAGRLTVASKGGRKRAGSPYAYQVDADLGETGFRLPGRGIELRSVNGHVEARPGTVAFLPVTGLVNGQRFSLRGNVTLGAAPSGQVDLRMAYLDLDALLPPKEEKAKVKEGPAREAPAGAKGFSARASVRVDAGEARGIEFTDLEGMVLYEKGDVVIETMTARLYGGTASVSGRIGLSGLTPDFRVNVALAGVEAGEILSRKTALKDFLSGPVTLSADLGGGTKDFAEFARSASGSGSFRVGGGRIKGMDLLGTAAGLAGLSGLAPGTALPGKGLAAAGETRFSDLGADFRIEGGKIRTDSLRIVSDKMGVTGTASIGFDRTFDFRGAVRIPKEAAARFKGTAGRFLAASDGSVAIPLVLSGPLASPAAAIDADALARGAADRLLRGLTEKGKGAPGAAPPPPGREEAVKAVEDLLGTIAPKKRK